MLKMFNQTKQHIWKTHISFEKHIFVVLNYVNIVQCIFQKVNISDRVFLLRKRYSKAFRILIKIIYFETCFFCLNNLYFWEFAVYIVKLEKCFSVPLGQNIFFLGIYFIQQILWFLFMFCLLITQVFTLFIFDVLW